MAALISPHGSDALNPLYVAEPGRNAALSEQAETLPSITLSSAAASNAVMMAAGYFNPLTGYMNKEDALSVAENMHTKSGLFWPTPVLCLLEKAPAIGPGQRIALRDPNVDGNPILAVMTVDAVETFTEDEFTMMTQKVFGTTDPNHPGVADFTSQGRIALSGRIQVLNYSYFPVDFPNTFRTAVEIRQDIEKNGWSKVVAFQTRNRFSQYPDGFR
ncbi:MAG: sulfate adenylyltransferase, partial [Rhizobiales bacterium]|nr:sulfate adenylyltransferase [Hyphomicrobiales bacterium]